MNKQQKESGATPAFAIAAELRAVIGKLSRRLREQAPASDFTWSQLSVLRRLEEKPATVTALARDESVRSQSMGATVAVLEAAGFVSGAPDPADGRQTILSLTPACREWLQAGRVAREDWLFQAMEKNLTAGEQEELASVARLLKRLADS
jgi:DNA-binding MarR family transcriptional regulator